VCSRCWCECGGVGTGWRSRNPRIQAESQLRKVPPPRKVHRTERSADLTHAGGGVCWTVSSPKPTRRTRTSQGPDPRCYHPHHQVVDFREEHFALNNFFNVNHVRRLFRSTRIIRTFTQGSCCTPRDYNEFSEVSFLVSHFGHFY
jgi:hypothetical protein